jgi:hypothetical protein
MIDGTVELVKNARVFSRTSPVHGLPCGVGSTVIVTTPETTVGVAVGVWV